MRKQDILVLFDYMYWTNRRLLDFAERLTPEAFVAHTEVTTRDLRGTLVHELDVEWSWRVRLQGKLEEDEQELRPEDYPDLATLRTHWNQNESEMRGWLDSLTDDQLAASVTSLPTEAPRPLWHYLLHILTHAYQQQADAATLLSLAGESPGELEYLSYLDTVEKARS